MNRNIFEPSQATVEFDAPSHVLKAIANLKKTGPEFTLIQGACDQLGLKCQSPGLIGETAIHFVVPKYKFGILFRNSPQTVNKKLREVNRLGWNLVVIIPEELTYMTQTAITAHLKAFVDSLKAKKLLTPTKH